MKERKVIKKNGNVFAYCSILPAILIILIVFLFPILFNFVISFTNTDLGKPLGNSDFVGISNYINNLKDKGFLRIFLRNFWWTITVVSLCFIIGLILAEFLQKKKFEKFFLIIWIIPWGMPEIAVAIVWVILLNPIFGPINYLLKDLHIISEPVAWLSSPNLAMWGVIMAGVWKLFPFYLAMDYAAIQTLPEDLIDAAKIDGASGIQIFLHLKIPWIRPIVLITLLLGFIWVFNWFSLVYPMTSGGPGSSTKLLSIYIYESALKYFNFYKASTLSIIALLAILPIVILYTRYYLQKSNELK